MTSNVSDLQNVIFACGLKVCRLRDAFQVAHMLISGDILSKDEYRSSRAGYDIYTVSDGGWVADLGDRLEVNFSDGRSKNIWYD